MATKTSKMWVVQNNGRAPLHFRRVWNTKNGKRPIVPLDDDGEPLPDYQEPESFQLHLGSVDDKGVTHDEDGNPILQCEADVSGWAVGHYRKIKMFKHYLAMNNHGIEVKQPMHIE